jgi:hypothetical protein
MCFIYKLVISHILFVDEWISIHFFNTEGKLQGLDAATAGALASMFAQIITTPVSNSSIIFCHDF